MTNITESELLAALRDYQQQEKAPADGTFTNKEFAEVVGVSLKKSLSLIRGMLNAGLVEHCPTVRINIIGQEYTERYAWRLIRKEE